MNDNHTNSQNDQTAGQARHLRLVSTSFEFKEDVAKYNPDAPKFVWMESPFYDGVKWAVRRGGSVLSKELEWEYEPSPSNRDEAFYERFRFESLEDAVVAFDSHGANVKGMARRGQAPI